MKCKTCNVQVSPKFAAAIEENRCPACGGQLMSDTHYQKIFHVKNQIKGLGFEPSQLIGIAAALTSKFTLVPKALGLEEDDEGNELEVELEDDEVVHHVSAQPKPMSTRRIQNAKGMSAKTAQLIEQRRKEAEEMADVSPQEQKAIIAEWGMEKGTKDNVSINAGDSGLDPELALAVANIDMGFDPEMPGFMSLSTGNGADARQQALLARAQMAKSNPSHIKVRRVDP